MQAGGYAPCECGISTEEKTLRLEQPTMSVKFLSLVATLALSLTCSAELRADKSPAAPGGKGSPVGDKSPSVPGVKGPQMLTPLQMPYGKGSPGMAGNKSSMQMIQQQLEYERQMVAQKQAAVQAASQKKLAQRQAAADAARSAKERDREAAKARLSGGAKPTPSPAVKSGKP